MIADPCGFKSTALVQWIELLTRSKDLIFIAKEEMIKDKQYPEILVIRNTFVGEEVYYNINDSKQKKA